MIQSNWLVGRRIVEEEQGGASRAEYGKALLKNLATELMPIYGNSYSARRLQDYRQFYLYFKDIERLCQNSNFGTVSFCLSCEVLRN